MWGDFLRNAAAQAQNIVGKVDELTSKGLEKATNLLETLDGLGDENENKEDDDQQEGGEEIGEEVYSPKTIEDETEAVVHKTSASSSGWGDDMEFSDEEHDRTNASLIHQHETEQDEHEHRSTSDILESQPMNRDDNLLDSQPVLHYKFEEDATESVEKSVSPIPEGRDIINVEADVAAPSTSRTHEIPRTEDHVAIEPNNVIQPETILDQTSAREKKLQRAYKKLEKDKNKIQDELTKVLSENDTLHTELRNLKQTFLVNQKEWEDEREGLMQTIHEFQRIVHNEEAKCKEAEKAFSVCELERNQLQQQVEELNQLLQSTREEYENVCDRCTELEQNGITELEIVKKQLEDSLSEIQVLRANQSQPETPRLMQSPVTAPVANFDISLVSSLQRNIGNLKQELESLRQGTFETTSAYDGEIKTLRTAVDQKFQQIATWRQSEIDAYGAEVAKLRDELATAQQKLHESDSHAAEWKVQFDQATEKIHFLEEEHQKSHVELLTKHKTVLEQMKKFKQSYKSQEKQLKEAQEENEELRKKISVLETETIFNTNTNKESQPHSNGNELDIVERDEQLQKYEEALAESANQLAVLKESLSNIEAKYEETKAELDSVRGYLSHYQTVAESTSQSSQEWQDRIAQLQETIAQMDKEKAELVEKQVQLVAERNSFEGSLKYLNGLFQEQEGELTKLKESIEVDHKDREKQNETLANQYEEKIQAYQTASAIEIERLERVIQEKEEVSEKLQKEVADLVKRLEENSTRAAEDVAVEDEPMQPPSSMEISQKLIIEENKRLQTELDALMASRDGLLDDKNGLKATIDRLHQQMSELTQQQHSQVSQVHAEYEPIICGLRATIDQLKAEVVEKENTIEINHAAANQRIQTMEEQWLIESQQLQTRQTALEASVARLTQENEMLQEKALFLQEQCQSKDKEWMLKLTEIESLKSCYEREKELFQEDMRIRREEIDVLKSAMEATQAQFNSACKDRDSFRERIESMEKEFAEESQQFQERQAELEESITDLTEEKELLQEKVIFIQEQCQMKDRELILTREDLSTVTTNLMEVEQSKAAVEEKHRALEQLLEDREVALHRLEEQLRDIVHQQETDKIHAQEIQELKMLVETLQNEKEELSVALEEKTVELETCEQSIVNLKKELNDCKQVSHQQHEALKVAFNEEITILTQNHRQDLLTLEGDLSLLRKELETKESILVKMKDDNMLLTTKLTFNDEEQMKLIQDLAQCQSLLQEKEQRLEQHQLDLSVSKIANDQLTHQIDKQQKELRHQQKLIEQGQQQQCQLQEQLQTLQMELSIKVEEINTLYTLNHDIQREKELIVKNLQEQCQELNQMVQSLKTHDEEITKERNHWEKKSIQFEQQLISLKQAHEECQSNLSNMSDLQEQYEELQENMKKMELKKKKDLEFLRKSNENIAQLQHELNVWKQKYQEEMSQLNQQHEEETKNLHQEIESLNRAVTTLTEERQALQEQLAVGAAVQPPISSTGGSSSSASQGSSSSFCMVSEVVSPLTPAQPIEQPKVSTHVDATVEHQDNETNTGEYLESLLHEISALKELLVQKEKEILKREEGASNLQQTIALLQNKMHDVESHSNMIVKQNQQYQKDLKVLEESLLQSTMSIGVPSSSSNNSATLPTQRQGRTPPVQSSNNGISSISGDLIVDLESANGPASPSPTMEKKELAGTHVIMVKVWELIRIYYPALLHTIGERPPRVGAVGQAVAIYVFCLQFSAVYMFFSLRSCRSHMI